MIIQLKKTENTIDYLMAIQTLLASSSQIMQVKEYLTFVSVKINTTCEDRYSAIIHERHYLHNDFVLTIYDRAKHENEVVIPFTEIDTIYSL